MHMNVRTLIATLTTTALLAGCGPTQSQGPSPGHGFETAGIGIGQLLLSPFLIAAGLLEGIVTLPYFVATDLHALNRGMVESGAGVDLDRTYRYAYEQELAAAPADGDTGAVFRHMSEATRHFQRVLMGYGVANYNQYVLTAVRSADREGYTLYAVIHRPSGAVRVLDEGSGRLVELVPGDRAYYRPYARDASGRPLDVIIDWAGVPRTSISTQKGQAILMTVAANSVLTNRRSDEYWSAESSWVGGGFRQIVAERDAYLKQRMGLPG
jgi:hypothetical protein